MKSKTHSSDRIGSEEPDISSPEASDGQVADVGACVTQSLCLQPLVEEDRQRYELSLHHVMAAPPRPERTSMSGSSARFLLAREIVKHYSEAWATDICVLFRKESWIETIGVVKKGFLPLVSPPGVHGSSNERFFDPRTWKIQIPELPMFAERREVCLLVLGFADYFVGVHERAIREVCDSLKQENESPDT